MRKVSTEQFIEKSKTAHPGKYLYEKTKYIDSYTPVILTCPNHGDFFTTSQKHLYARKKGCPACGKEKCRGMLGNYKRTNEECIIEAKKLYGDRYDYQESNFNPAKTKTKIICALHGAFFQSYITHVLHKCECYRCSRLSAGKKKSLSTQQLQNLTKENHQLINREGRKLEFNCPEHGAYKLDISNLYKTPNCPVCANKTSLAQKEIFNFVQQGLKAELNYRYSQDSKKEVDIFLPEKNIAIELNGVFWHSTGAPKYQALSVHERRKAALHGETEKHSELSKLGIRLITITDFEWQQKKGAVKNILGHVIGQHKRVLGRETEVRYVDDKEAREFLNKFHLQGACTSRIYYGLFYRGELIAVMSFRKQVELWELKRYCCTRKIIGGAAKLLSAFVGDFKPKKIVSFCHERLFSGAIYVGLGFTKTLEYGFDYYFIYKGVQYYRGKFMRKRIPLELQCKGLFETTEKIGAWTMFVPGGAKYELDLP